MIIHELWSAGDRAYMIMPGDVPLDESRVRNQFVRYLPDGWDAVVDSDVDGLDSRPKELDEKVGSLGRYHAARRVARSVFVGSAPSVAGQRVRGVEEVRVRLGCVQPGESAAVSSFAVLQFTSSAAYACRPRRSGLAAWLREGMALVAFVAGKRMRRRSMTGQATPEVAAERGSRLPVGTVHVVDPHPSN